jgi:predicted enzyme related to lactoylglutathione lyase
MTKLDRKQPHGMPSWADLMTDDPEAARAFYGALFGWTFDIGGPESGHYTMCKTGAHNAAGLGGKPPGAAMPNAWTLYLAVDDLDATCRKLAEAGGRVTMPPMQVMDAGKMAIAQEPTGAVFGMWQAGQHTGFQISGEPGAFAWTELNTRDLPRAQAFLEAVFGYRAEKLPGEADMAYRTLHVGDAVAGGILQMTDKWPAELPPHWMIYFAVERTDAAVEQVKSLGGAVHVPPFDTPYGRIAVVTDPQRAAFSVIQLPAG